MVSSNQLYCIPCGATDINKCRCKRGNCSTTNVAVEGSLFAIELEDGTQMLSQYIRENINEAYQSCSQGESKSCEQLANLCVLQNYRKQPQSACNLLETMQNSDRLNPQSVSNNKLAITFNAVMNYYLQGLYKKP
uniref:Uncharacterized protein n=1 Tax=Parascaris equorum TaxID=6256 RepID=A0A914S7E3_PAREQ